MPYWIDRIRHQRKLSSQQRWFDRFSKESDEAIEAAEKERDRDKYDGLVSEYLHERDLFENEVARIETRFLVEEARRYLIPVPPMKEGEGWERSKVDDRLYLDFTTMRELRNSIREERRLRIEPMTVWLSLGIGLVGAITGLVAVLG